MNSVRDAEIVARLRRDNFVSVKLDWVRACLRFLGNTNPPVAPLNSSSAQIAKLVVDQLLVSDLRHIANENMGLTINLSPSIQSAYFKGPLLVQVCVSASLLFFSRMVPFMSA